MTNAVIAKRFRKKEIVTEIAKSTGIDKLIISIVGLKIFE